MDHCRSPTIATLAPSILGTSGNGIFMNLICTTLCIFFPMIFKGVSKGVSRPGVSVLSKPHIVRAIVTYYLNPYLSNSSMIKMNLLFILQTSTFNDLSKTFSRRTSKCSFSRNYQGYAIFMIKRTVQSLSTTLCMMKFWQLAIKGYRD